MRCPVPSLIVVAAVVAAIVPTWHASAHARLKSSTPGVGEVLATSPARVEIEFTQEVQKISGTYGIDVAQDGGPKVTSGEAVLDDADRTRMSVELQSSLPAGRYIVTYRNVSDVDGDSFEGEYAFYVGREPTAEEIALDEALLAEDDAPTVAPTEPAGVSTPGPSTPQPRPTPGDTTAIGDNDADSPLVIIFAVSVILGVAAAGAFFVYRRRNG